jgi:SAM-dependent methyltransferase
LSKTFIFDNETYAQICRARANLLQTFLPELQRQLGLRTAIDVGCGTGFFSEFLRDSEFRVTALDGRKENVEEAQRRVGNVDFRHADVEDQSLPTLGLFDLVLCFGLLYHLENPFRAIRNLFALTKKVLIVESMCVPDESSLLYLLDEGNLEDQALNYIALYPSEGCLIKMMWRAGFPYVYSFRNLPDHDLFRDTRSRKRSRTMLVGSQVRLDIPALVPAAEPGNLFDPWAVPSVGEKAKLFLSRPWGEKLQAMRRRFGVAK